MTRTIFTFAVFFFSCGQPVQKTKTKHSPTNPSTDNSSIEFADNRATLDSLFLLKKDSSKFISHNDFTSLSIGKLFSKTNKEAVLTYKDNDSVLSVVVLRESENKWDTILFEKVDYLVPTSQENSIEISDFNGDNRPDLKVVKHFWDMHPGENSALWIHHENRFTKVKGFDSIVTAKYDPKTKLIYSYQSTGCADMAMYFGVFKIVGDNVHKITEMNCNCCVEPKDSCTIEVVGEKLYVVPYKTAYKHVPQFYGDFVKEKCEMVAK